MENSPKAIPGHRSGSSDMLKHAATLSIALILFMASLWVVMVAGQKHHFPTGALHPDSPGADDFANNWYSAQLEAMSEPVLKPTAGTRTYRFTWLRTSSHPVAVRIVVTQERCMLYATELDGAGGHAPGKVFRRKTETLSPEQCDEFEQVIERSGFWRLPPRGDVEGSDGSEWIVEGVASRYYVVSRWTPESGPVRVIGERFLALAGWRYTPREMY